MNIGKSPIKPASESGLFFVMSTRDLTLFSFKIGDVDPRAYSMFSQKWVFDKMGFSIILEISRRVLDFSKMGFRRNGFFFWASRLNTQKWFIFTRDFLAIFPNLCFLSRAQILKNGLSKKCFFLSAFWERKLEKWLTIFARTYCIVTLDGWG